MIDKEMLNQGLSDLGKKLDSAIELQNANNGKASESLRADMKAMAQDHEGMIKELQNTVGDLQTGIEQGSLGHAGGEAKAESVGKQFVNSDGYASFKNGSSTKARVEFQNNTITTGGDNSVTRHEQLPGVVPGAYRQLTVLPTVESAQTSSNIVYYSREASFANGAAPTAEGGSKPEATLTFEEVSVPIVTVPHFLKVSKQALDDSTFLQSYIDRRLSYGVQLEIENQIITGDGTGQNFSGWLATGNNVVTDPAGTVDIYGLASKMKYEIIGADYVPDYFYMNPADWANAETARRGTGDNAFVAASGAVVYVNNGLTALLWGIPVVLSNSVPVGTMVCKSRDADMYLDRMQTVVEMFEQDGDNVQTNLVTVRAEARGAEAVMIPAAIRTGDITGITP